MSTLAEIEEAIEHLPLEQREMLEARLLARQFGDGQALDEALQDAIVDADQDADGGKSPAEVRELINQWISKSDCKSGR